MNLKTALDWLYSTQLFGIKLGLENTTELLAKADALPGAGVTVVHVAGTNGKGSTCAMIEAIARAGGVKTGLFTSPHLVDFSERMRVNGTPIPERDLVRLLGDARALSESCETPPTFFELALLIALKYFKEQGVEMMILETGLGGRLDATNTVAKNVAVLTPIAMDHQQYLGNSLADVAREKAGIIACGLPVVSAVQEKEAMDVIAQAAQEKDSSLIVATADENTPVPALRGEHQRMNAALAIGALRAIGRLPSAETIASALSNVNWPGRFEKVDSANLILDGAHNPHAMRVLTATWKQQYGERKTRVIFAASADKNVGEIITLLDEIVSEWHLVPCSSPRIMPSQEMKQTVESISDRSVTVHDSLQQAIAQNAHGDVPTLVTGSLFLIGDAKALLADTERRATAQ